MKRDDTTGPAPRSASDRPAPYVIRHRAEHHLDACVDLLAEVHERDGYPRRWPADPAGWLTHPALLAAWVAESDGVPVGHVALCCATDADAAPPLWARQSGTPAEGAGVVSRLFVAPRARGQGVGTRLVAAVVRGARERGLHPVLEVLDSDTAATALYERLGWQRLATVRRRWGTGETVTVHCYAGPAA
ncbi:GNAT family N-acetyltransferase [Allostreptomyces psammosilenae]|uniref:GNAT superfamily N-acetyltransferase n=1 Tax=Allostreptomyces psammosilenae TaxID=1892865 RepID=A0A853A0W3_9ACTN|nr:GNAT family N-acetyltransferase [Allostreptomyces psammosilenae]NYI08253.1 GNAT superfamily N-acetyltransferase [Allostreptomyces psammosilenae]